MPDGKITRPVVVFDAFGTVVQFGERLSPYRKLMTWMRENGRQPQPDDAARVMNRPLGLAGVASAFGVSPPLALLAQWELDLHTEINTIKMFPDTLPALMLLRSKGYRIGLCSNLAAPYGAPVKAMLPSLDAYAWSYEAGAIKPEPAIYQYLLGQLGCAAGDILFIGDTPSADRDGPLAFGMAARLIDRPAGQTLDDVLHDL